MAHVPSAPKERADFLTNFFVPKPNLHIEDESRLRFCLILTFVAIVVFTAFIIINLDKVSQFRTILNICSLMTQILILALLRIHRNPKIAFRISVAMLLIYFLFLLKIGGAHGTRLLWILIIPVYALFLLGKIEGLVWTLVGFLASAIILVNPTSIFSTYPYEGEWKFRVLIMYALLGTIAYIFESVRRRFQDIMENNQQNLVSEVERRAKVEAELKQYQDHLEDRVKEGVAVLKEANELLTKEIEERARTEMALRNSEEKFRSLVETSSDWIWEVDANGVYTYTSPQVRELLGYEPYEIEGKKPFDFMSPSEADRVATIFRQKVEARESICGLENENIHKDGSTVLLETSGVPVFNDDEALVGYRGIDRDITSRKVAEEALRASEAKAQMLLRQMDAIIWTVDANYRITSLRGAGLGKLGLEPDQVVGMTLEESLGPGNSSTPAIEAVKRSLNGESVTYEDVIDDLTLETRVEPLRDDFDRIVGAVAVSVDITSRKHAEQERLRLERQVQHAQKLESLGVLAGGIAHDFNNLLTAILGNAELALMRLSPVSPACDNIKEIEISALRAASLANQMLAYSGKGKFVVQAIDLSELVKEMAQLLEVSISKKNVLKYNCSEHLPRFDGDATQIRQVVMNLITNASEAIGNCDGFISISTGAMYCDREYLKEMSQTVYASYEDPLPEGTYIYLEVSDTGCGMNAEVQRKVFDPFFTTKFSGRGLGMAAVLGILRGHKGAIKIYSEPGKGTTFKILFPARENQIQQEDRLDDKMKNDGWSMEGTILIAEDEEVVRGVAKQMIEEMGLKAITASDGQQAVELFRKHASEIICVLLDLTMPILDGQQVFNEIRRVNPDIKVLLCSGYNEQDATQRFAGKGLAGFIQKPYTFDVLKTKLQEIVQNKLTV